MQLGALILAGGRSRRMGRPKESLPWGDETLLSHTVQSMMDCAWPVFVVARDGEQNLPPYPIEADLVYDDDAGQGPLAAMVSGMKAMDGKADAVFITGCDTPLLTPDTVGWLAGRLGDRRIVVPRVGDHLQILSAVMRLEVLGAAQELLAEGIRTPRTLVERCPATILEEADLADCPGGLDAFRSLNTPEEYEAAHGAHRPG